MSHSNKKGSRKKALRAVGGSVWAKCGCLIPHKTEIAIDRTTFDHAASSAVVPIICPICGQRTVVNHKKVRGG